MNRLMQVKFQCFHW